LARPGWLEAARAGLEAIGRRPDARAEALAPAEYAALAERLVPDTGDRR
jgi:hypothetical protein